MRAVLAVPVRRALAHEQPTRVVRAPHLGLVLRVEDDHRDVDEAARVGGDEDRRVVEPRLALDESADQVAQRDGVRAREPRDGREADVPSLLAAVPPGHRVDVEVRDPGLDPLVRVLELGERVRRVLLAPHLGARDPLECLLHLAEAVVDDGLVAVEGEAHHASGRPRARARSRRCARPGSARRPRTTSSATTAPTRRRSCSRSAARSRSSVRASACAGSRPARAGRRRSRPAARAACSTPAWASARRPSS